MRRDPQTVVQDAIRAAEDIVALLGDMTESQFVSPTGARHVPCSAWH
jgi:uncharacterized protein with HEPN domain